MYNKKKLWTHLIFKFNYTYSESESKVPKICIIKKNFGLTLKIS
jgi:hypothetical protein